MCKRNWSSGGGYTIYRAAGRDNQSTHFQSKYQSKFVDACISQLHLVLYFSWSSYVIRFSRRHHQKQIKVFAKDIDHWGAALWSTERMVGSISLPWFKAKFKANLSMHASESYTCYYISLAPPTPRSSARGFIDNKSRFVQKLLTIGERLYDLQSGENNLLPG